MASTIGIKIANGTFFPILEENVVVKKRLLLTTVHDNQKSVHIDLYKTARATIESGSYIGGLIVENIREKPKGQASIELVVASDANGELVVDAIDLDRASGVPQHLRVTRTTTATSSHVATDFTLERQSQATPSALYDSESPKKKSPLLFVGLAVLLIVIILLLLFLFIRPGKPRNNAMASAGTNLETVAPVPVIQEVPPPAPVEPAPLVVAEAPEAPLPPEAADTQEASFPLEAPLLPEAPPLVDAVADTPLEVSAETAPTGPVVIEAPSEEAAPPPEPPTRTRPLPPVASYNVPTTIPRSGALYRIRWGDTLWDISEAFYRNPWLYPRIARFNNLRNPDLIISGTTIRIPPRS
jgi:hypothetical protein